MNRIPVFPWRPRTRRQCRQCGRGNRVRRHMVVGTASTMVKLAANNRFSATFKKGICEQAATEGEAIRPSPCR
jgi:hypothetical protein